MTSGVCPGNAWLVQKLTRVIPDIKLIKIITISTDAGKVFEVIQHPLLIKPLNRK